MIARALVCLGLTACLVLAVAAAAPPAHATATATAGANTSGGQKPPPPVGKIGVDEHVGRKVPLDLPFLSVNGRRVHLGDYFGDGKPVILVLAYVRCKMLCDLVLRGVATAIHTMKDQVPGTDYRVITVSIDPKEEPAASLARRNALLKEAGFDGKTGDWIYLLGADHTIHALADAVGFRYTWDPRSEQFAHPAVIFILTPDGTISRYLYGVGFPAPQVEQALAAARRGEAEPAPDVAQTVLSCFHFDPALRKYRERIGHYLLAGGLVIFGTLLSLVGALFVWERRRLRRQRNAL